MRDLRLPWSLSGVNWNDYSVDRCNKFFKRTLNYISYTAKNSGERINNDVYRKALESIEDTKAKDVMKTFIDEFREEGYALGHKDGRVEGRKEGRKEGRAEGRNEGRYETIFGLLPTLLNDRFGQVPECLWNKINTIDDYPSLTEIMKFAWKADSLDDIERFVQRLGAQKQD